ncbi:hypothetical protein ATZ36_08800 [Candidatus Endomicrobiellum trichonymphae]|uniref:Lipoprotein n=1 Tax=Endomicrobium trichonymphae TaxID=1408204 RepID=A0A1E5IGP5_ENDTX|nr:hypothetical protein ATZ36_08800 [Candidatus Endomicrobium trichonymphae]
MKKIISIMLMGMMTVGCGKTARLERDRLEAAQEQTRLATEAEQSRYKGVWERFTNHVHNNKVGYGVRAAITFVGIGVFAAVKAVKHCYFVDEAALNDDRKEQLNAMKNDKSMTNNTIKPKSKPATKSQMEIIQVAEFIYNDENEIPQNVPASQINFSEEYSPENL